MKSRPAQVADKLTVRDFGRGTKGFCPADQCTAEIDDTVAVCVLPGTEIAFDEPIRKFSYGGFFSSADGVSLGHSVARFRQVDKDCQSAHHDALELPDGQIVKLTTLAIGQTATVLQLPAAPKTEQEAQDQKRLEIVA
jgi:hypothetical protein